MYIYTYSGVHEIIFIYTPCYTTLKALYVLCSCSHNYKTSTKMYLYLHAYVVSIECASFHTLVLIIVLDIFSIAMIIRCNFFTELCCVYKLQLCVQIAVVCTNCSCFD